MNIDGAKLLADYVENGSEAAFRELVGRYTDLVYSVAIRLVNGDRHLAEDIAQNVFIDLARMARTLSKGAILGGWLHRHTCFVASKAVRSERRRQAREKQAAEMNALEHHSEANLSQLAPVLDEAINRLGDEDRAAIILRFFEQRDYRSVGQALGSNEDTAQKRVSRALVKLQALLSQKGVTLPAAGLATVLAATSIQAAPAGLAASLATMALSAPALGGGTTLTLMKVIVMTKAKIALGAIAAATVTVPFFVQQRSLTEVRAENASLRQRVEQLAQTTVDNERLSNLLAQAKSSTSEDVGELLRLRGEVSGLRRQLADAVKQQKTAAPVPDQPVVPEPSRERQKEIAIAKMNYTKYWMLGFLKYAEQHQGQFPATFEQAAPFMPDEIKGQTNLTTDQFEIVYQGSMSAIEQPARIIVIREKEAWPTPDGGWARDYTFADGHCEIHKADDGNFEPWESQHMFASATGAQPGQ